jgi:hypothetical protein
MNTSYVLLSGTELNKLHPNTFHIPLPDDKAAIRAGDFVKLIFDGGDTTERMWVRVTAITAEGLTGELADEPFSLDCIRFGDAVKFAYHHIVAVIPGLDH